MDVPDALFQVSVITPVYNAARWVRRAVESAVALPQVGEVILVEDGSLDDALEVCRQLAAAYPTVRVVQHPDGGNHGAGASRNLGIENAQFPFVAFLDADDWYLPHRFREDARILMDDPSIDGVYNALGNHYESEDLHKQWLTLGRSEFLTVTAPVPPEELIFVLLWAHPSVTGEFHTNTVTVRRDFFERTGVFDLQLRLQQDTHLWKRMAAAGRLAGGNLTEPVAIRGVHTHNRSARVEDYEPYRELWWSSLRQSFRQLRVQPAVMQAYRRAYAAFRSKRRPRWKGLFALANWVFREPSELRRRYGHFDLTLQRLFQNRQVVIRLLSFKNRIFGREA